MIADYRANLTQLRVDRLGRLLEHEDADTGVQVYRYTAFDQVLTLTEGDGDAVRGRHHTYDELGRLTSLVAPEGTTAFSFDGPGDNAEGRLVESTGPSGATEHLEYEARPADGDPMKNRGFVEHISRLIDGTTFTSTLGYDPTSSQLSRVAYPSSAVGEPFTIHYQSFERGEQLALQQFDAVLNDVANNTPKVLPVLEEFIVSEKWQILADAARLALQRLEGHGS